MQCRKCGKTCGNRIVVDGKVRNIKNRKYCLSCSPFGKHNTRKVEKLLDGERVCGCCEKRLKRKNEHGYECWVCRNRKQREEKAAKIRALMGGGCGFCGYNKCQQALDCHHVDRTSKLFELNGRELQRSWSDLVAEAKKCVLACCRCHREVHAGLIVQEEVERLHKEIWDRSSIG